MPRQVILGALPLDMTDGQGVTWTTVDLSGWRGSPATTLEVTQRPAAPGGWPSADPVLTPRQMELRIDIAAPDSASMTAAYEQLLAAAGTGPVTLTVTEDGLTRQAVVYRNGEILPVDDGGDWATYSVPLIAPDPRRYGGPVTVTVPLPASSGGLSWPVSWPISWPATVTAGDATLPGGGSGTTTPLVITVYGPVSGPPLAAPLVRITTDSGVVSTLLYTDTVAAGDWLAIDTSARTVLYNGVSTRRGLLQVMGDWPQLPPGGGQVAFRASAYDATSRAVVSYRPAWT